ncbi:MAG: glycoside hydrolase family 44 protein [Myxococcaceae bacterium]|nr:glycoside hydrolase family 44 protein [Myxococcaceae bacterium]
MSRLLAVLLIVAGCHSPQARASSPTPPTRDAGAPTIVEPVYDGELKGGWEDHGWAEHAPRKGRGETLKLENYGGWILTKYALQGTFGGLVFHVKAPAAFGDFLEARVDSESVDVFPRVQVTGRHVRALGDGWAEVFISMRELNPKLLAFNRIKLRAFRELPPPGLVEFDRIGLTGADDALVREAQALLEQPGLPAALAVDCRAPGTTISPLIYGIAYSALRERDSTHQFELNATIRRWGGNPTSRYNWELGNAWNTGADYFYWNTAYGHPPGERVWQTFLEVNRDRGLKSALTVPMLGWVAKDTKSASFPVADFGPQQQLCPENASFGNGVDRSGKPLTPGPATRTSLSIQAPFVEKWVAAIKQLEAKRGRVVHQYILDNEPALWHDTHRDVHPRPATYDEVLEKTIAFGTAIRKADPDALIAGPAEWGWPGYFFSAADAEAGFGLKPDRRAHDDVPFIEWYLKKLAAHEKKTGVRVLDVLDLHYYPQAKGLGVGTEGQTDADTNALRLRSTRSLWDPRYLDESWVKEPVRLLPRMQEWVAANYPGLKLSIGEYNFGAEGHISGGLALAEALGRFGQHGLYSAFYWTYPPDKSPAFWAFRAFRNFDGQGARFEEVSLPTEAPRELSLFAARSTDKRRMTLVLLNLSTSETMEAAISLKGCALPTEHRVFTYVGDPRGFAPVKTALGKAYRAPPSSITVVELKLGAGP